MKYLAKHLFLLCILASAIPVNAQLPDIHKNDSHEEENDWEDIYSINEYDYFVLMEIGGGYMHSLTPTGTNSPADLLSGSRYNMGAFSVGAEYSFDGGEGLLINFRLDVGTISTEIEDDFNTSLISYLGNYTVVNTDIEAPAPEENTVEAQPTGSSTTFALQAGYQLLEGKWAFAVFGGGHFAEYVHLESYSTVKLNGTNRYYFVDFQAEDHSTYGYGYQAGLRLMYKPWDQFGFSLRGHYFRSYYDYDFYEYETDIFTSQETTYRHSYDDVVDWVNLTLSVFMCF